jgi:iron complex outermembrane receptor protein
MTGKRLLSSLAIGTFLSMALAAAAGADTDTDTETTDATPKSTGTSEGFGLEEIVVSAQRRSENLQVVPIAVTVISGDDIRQKNIVDPQDLNGSVPGLTVSQAFNSRASSIYVIRGQGQTLGGGDPAVATYFNDVPTPATGPGYLFDLSNVEVLKGPQGTLFGRNSTGGAVLFVPQHPTNDFDGYVDVTAGNYAARRYQAAVNVPLIRDVLLVRFAVDANYRDGYTTNPVNGQQFDDIDYQAARLGVTFTPNEWFENYLLVNFATLNEKGPGSELVSLNPGVGLAKNPLVQEAFAAQQAWGPRLLNAYLPPTGNYIKTRNYAADNTSTIKLADDITLKNILGFREFLYAQSYSYYGLPFPNFELIGGAYIPGGYWSSGQGIPNPSNKTYSDELQLHGNSFQKHLHWTTGLYFDTTSPHSNEDRDLALINGKTLQSSDAIRHAKSKAVYGEFTYDLTDQLKFTGGARYTDDSRSQVANQYYPNLFPCVNGQPFPPTSAGLGYCDVTRSATFKASTWNASLQYQLNPDTMFYLTSRHGYKSGGFNGVAPTPETQSFQPEYVTDLELGEKTEFQIGSVKGRVNADVFRSHFSGWQERITITQTTAVAVQRFAVITNVGEGINQGAEFEVTIIPTPRVELSAYYSYLDAYATSNTIGGVNYDNVRIPNAPKKKASATARYLLGLPSTAGEASVSATYSYQSEFVDQLVLATPAQLAANTDPFHGATPGYGVLNLHADWNDVLGHPLDLNAFCDNATNKTYLALLADSYVSQGKDGGEYGAPRMFGVSARWRFK